MTIRSAFFLAVSAVLTLAAAIPPAAAQSNPGWATGFVPSAQQWAQEWSSKLDYSINATSIPIATAATPSPSNDGATYYATAALTFTLPLSTGMYPTSHFTVIASAGAVTIAVASTDVLCGPAGCSSAGAGATIPSGATAVFTTDAAGHWRYYSPTTSGGTGAFTTLAVTPTANSLMQGITVTQSGSGTPTATSGCGTATFMPNYVYNCINVASDAVNAGTLSGDKESFVFAVVDNIDGGSGNLNKNAFLAFIDLTQLPAGGITASTFYNPTQLVAEADVASGCSGTSLSSACGTLTGNGVYGIAGPAATGYRGVTVQENDLDLQPGSSVRLAVGYAATRIATNSTVQGADMDASFVTDTANGGIGWKCGWCIGGWSEDNLSPISAGGSFVTAFNGASGGTVLGTMIDLSGDATVAGTPGTGYTCTGDYIKFSANTHFKCDGSFIISASGGTDAALDAVQTSGSQAEVAAFENSGGIGVTVVINPRTAAQAGCLAYEDAGTPQFGLCKTTGNAAILEDLTNSAASIFTASLGASGTLTLGEGGAYLVLLRNPYLTQTTPTDTETCTAGQLWVDASYIYSCAVSGTVKRAALSTF